MDHAHKPAAAPSHGAARAPTVHAPAPLAPAAVHAGAPPATPPDHLALLPWMDDYIATAKAAPAVGQMHAHMASLAGAAHASALVATKDQTDENRGRWQFLNQLDAVDDVDVRHAMMGAFEQSTGQSLDGFVAGADWHGDRDRNQALALISPARDATDRRLAAMAPAEREALAAQAGDWAQQVLAVTRRDDADDDENAQQIARVLGPRSPEEIEAIRAAMRANTNHEHSIYEELDRSLSGGNADEAVAGLSGDPVHAASMGLINADGDPARTTEILRGLDPAQLAAMKARGPFGVDWIADNVEEGPHRDEVVQLLAGDRRGADAARLGSLLQAPDQQTRFMARKGFEDAEREVAARSDQAVLAEFESKAPADVVAAREAWDRQAAASGGPSWDDMLEERFADGDHTAYLRMQALSHGDRAEDRALALHEGMRVHDQQAIEAALANPDLHSPDLAKRAAAEAEQRAIGERARSLDGVAQHILGMLNGDASARGGGGGRDLDTQLHAHYAEVAAHHPDFDNPFKALEYELNRDEHLEVQQTTARDDAFAAGELWKDGALGTLTQIRRAEVKDDTAKTAALIDSVKTTKGLEDLQQQFQKRYDKPMIEAPDLADFEMRAHLAKLDGDDRPLADIQRALAREDMDANELRLDNARQYGAKGERREDLELKLQRELIDRQHSGSLDMHEQLRAMSGGNVGTEELAREQLEAADAMLEPRKDVFGLQPRELKAGVGKEQFDQIDTNLTRTLEVQREEKSRLAARTGKIFATIAKLGALVTVQPELMIAIDALGHLGEMAIKSSIAGVSERARSREQRADRARCVMGTARTTISQEVGLGTPGAEDAPRPWAERSARRK